MSSVRVAVDLTPLLPEGTNGGIKVVICTLIRCLGRIAPSWTFVLLTNHESHDELKYLDSRNVRRICVTNWNKSPEHSPSKSFVENSRRFSRRLESWLRKKSIAILPLALNMRIDYAYQAVLHHFSERKFLKSIDADLLFSPFATPRFFNPSIPFVATIVDLQYIFYPKFISPQNQYFLLMHFRKTCRVAKRIICISDYVRDTVLKNSNCNPKRVKTIHASLFNRLKKPSQEQTFATLHRLGLKKESYLYYPANFWQHKNHLTLLTAFDMYLFRHPGSCLKLVLTGVENDHMDTIKACIIRIGLEQQVIFPGYLSQEDFTVVLSSCRALIFPSLYEGFGMPILEAMSFGRPVACSNVTSLPEVAGNAALYFDPERPKEISLIIEQIETNPELRKDLVERGYKRLETFASITRIAEQYLTVFENSLKASSN